MYFTWHMRWSFWHHSSFTYRAVVIYQTYSISKKLNFLSSSCYNIVYLLSLKHKKGKKHAEHEDSSIRSGTHLSLLSVLLCSSPRFAKIFCLFCYRRLKWLCFLRDLASKVMNTKGKPMRKIQPAGYTVHVSFVRTQGLSVECRPFTLPLLRPYLLPTVGPAWADEFPSAVTMVIRTPLTRARQ